MLVQQRLEAAKREKLSRLLEVIDQIIVTVDGSKSAYLRNLFSSK